MEFRNRRCVNYGKINIINSQYSQIRILIFSMIPRFCGRCNHYPGIGKANKPYAILDEEDTQSFIVFAMRD